MVSYVAPRALLSIFNPYDFRSSIIIQTVNQAIINVWNEQIISINQAIGDLAFATAYIGQGFQGNNINDGTLNDSVIQFPTYNCFPESWFLSTYSFNITQSVNQSQVTLAGLFINNKASQVQQGAVNNYAGGCYDVGIDVEQAVFNVVVASNYNSYSLPIIYSGISCANNVDVYITNYSNTRNICHICIKGKHL